MSDDAEAAILMNNIRALASTKRHRLAPDQVNGTRMHTLPAAKRILAYLSKCQDLQPEPVRAQPAEKPVVTQPAQSPAPRATGNFPPPLSAFGDIPGGYFATPSATGRNDFDFWRVDRPEKGRWAGHAFVKRILGGGIGDEMRTVEISNMQQRLALVAIREVGVEEAGMLFARHLGRCTDCGRVLTDETSKFYGKGETCRNKKK